MINFIKLTYNNYIDYNINKKNNVYNTFFDPDSGLTDEQMNFLMNPSFVFSYFIFISFQGSEVFRPFYYLFSFYSVHL